MKFDSEKELEDLVFDQYNESSEVIIDGSCPDFLFRQLSLGDYGICDLVSIDILSQKEKIIEVKIYELKNGPITSDALIQVCRYRSGIEKAVSAIPGVTLHDVSLAVVGLSIDKSCYVVDSCGIEYFEVRIDPMSGLFFDDRSSGWHITNGSLGSSMASKVYGMFPELNGGGLE